MSRFSGTTHAVRQRAPRGTSRMPRRPGLSASGAAPICQGLRLAVRRSGMTSPNRALADRRDCRFRVQGIGRARAQVMTASHFRMCPAEIHDSSYLTGAFAVLQNAVSRSPCLLMPSDATPHRTTCHRAAANGRCTTRRRRGTCVPPRRPLGPDGRAVQEPHSRGASSPSTRSTKHALTSLSSCRQAIPVIPQEPRPRSAAMRLPAFRGRTRRQRVTCCSRPTMLLSVRIRSVTPRTTDVSD